MPRDQKTTSAHSHLGVPFSLFFCFPGQFLHELLLPLSVLHGGVWLRERRVWSRSYGAWLCPCLLLPVCLLLFVSSSLRHRRTPSLLSSQVWSSQRPNHVMLRLKGDVCRVYNKYGSTFLEYKNIFQLSVF